MPLEVRTGDSSVWLEFAASADQLTAPGLACHVMVNARPSGVSGPGVAPAVDDAGPVKAPPDPACVGLGMSCTRVAANVGSEIVPGWLLPIVAALLNETVPKFASATGRHEFVEVQRDGASAIHSAEDRSGAWTFTLVV
jgi:hypothetical protein